MGLSQNLTERLKCISRSFDNAMLKVSSNDKREFKGTKGNTLVIYTNYPIRCTLQYYWVTYVQSMLTEPLVKTMKEQLEKFYSNSSNKSSLVIGKTERSTEPKGMELIDNTIQFNLLNPQFQVQMNQ